MPATAMLDTQLPAALEAKGLTAPLDLPENAQDLQAALAAANGVPEEQALEWLASSFGLLPYTSSRPSLTVQAERAFRELAAEEHEGNEEPWLPVGVVGPLLIMAHYNPAARARWEIPEAFVLQVLVGQRQYTDFKAVLAERLQAKPLAPRSTPLAPNPLEENSSPEKALKWLLSGKDASSHSRPSRPTM